MTVKGEGCPDNLTASRGAHNEDAPLAIVDPAASAP
jgi:hypothetical protein